MPAVVPQLASAVAKAWDAKPYTSTQEQAWMLLAARALKGEDKDVIDNYDVPADGKECTRDVCNAVIPVSVNTSTKLVLRFT